MKYIALLSFVIALSLTASAQHTRGEVVLKNGTTVTGQIIQQGISQGVTLRTDEGTIVRYEEEEIARITQSPGRVSSTHGGIYVREKGFYQRFSYGMGFTEGTRVWDGRRSQFVTTTLEAVSGYRFSPKLNVGFGLGITFHGDGASTAPFYIDFRGDWDLPGSNKTVVPHYFLDFGYGLAAGRTWDRNYTDYRGGIFTHGGLGLKFRCRGRAEWTLTAGLRRQDIYEEYTLWNDPNTLVSGNRTKQSLEFQLGFMF